MELAVREAKARLSELISAAEKGERVVITTHGVPAVELVRCRPRGSIDFDKLEETRRRLGIEDAPEDEVAEWKAAFEDPAFSRRVLGLGGCPAGSRKSAATVHSHYPAFSLSARAPSSSSR